VGSPIMWAVNQDKYWNLSATEGHTQCWHSMEMKNPRWANKNPQIPR